MWLIPDESTSHRVYDNIETQDKTPSMHISCGKSLNDAESLFIVMVHAAKTTDNEQHSVIIYKYFINDWRWRGLWRWIQVRNRISWILDECERRMMIMPSWIFFPMAIDELVHKLCAIWEMIRSTLTGGFSQIEDDSINQCDSQGNWLFSRVSDRIRCLIFGIHFGFISDSLEGNPPRN